MDMSLSILKIIAEIATLKELLQKEDAVDKYIQLGRCLVALKGSLAHGEFLPVLKEIGISAEAASRAMKVAKRFNSPLTENLARSLRHPTKLIELATRLGEDEIDALARGETVLGVSPAQLEELSIQKLRMALRDAVRGDEPLPGIDQKLLEDEQRLLEAWNRCNARDRAILLSLAISMAGEPENGGET